MTIEPEPDVIQSAFEMGRQSVSYRIEDLERRERAVREAEQRIKGDLVALGVARYAYERNIMKRSTVLTVEWEDVEMRGAQHMEPRDLIDMVKPQVDDA